MKNKKEKVKTKDTYSIPEMKHYLGALAETYNENLKGIKDGFVLVNRKIDGVVKTLDSHTKTLDSHTKILDLHTEMVGVLMEDTTILKEDMQIVKNELKKKVDYDEFLSLVKRVQKIESKL